MAVRADGTGFQRLHAFSGANDGRIPASTLILDGFGHLFGTAGGGAAGGGTLFSIGIDGGFQVLHAFAGGVSDGSSPGSLTLGDSGTLYGTTGAGGSSDFGTVFRLRTDGTRFEILHSFAGGASDGRLPDDVLLLDDSGNLYGTTGAGGQPPIVSFGSIDDGAGTIFRIKTDGTGYQLLRAFPSGTRYAASASPSGPLVTDGSGNLYGVTYGGGSSNSGTVYRIGMNGSDFLILHSFSGGSIDGKYPVGRLALDRLGNLFGMTQGDSAGVPATIFTVGTDGTGFQLLHTFGDPNEGLSPAGSLILDGPGTLFGAMSYGGTTKAGTIFSVKTDGSVFRVRYTFVGFLNDGKSPGAVISDGSGYVYGVSFGGLSDSGTVYRIRSDGTGFQLLHSFADETGWPSTPLIMGRAGNLYGMTSGSPSSFGTIFKMRTDGTGFQTLHTFLGDPSDGNYPDRALVLDDADNLYGTTPRGGTYDLGTIFTLKADGTEYRLLHSFGSAPVSSEWGGTLPSSLLLDGSGGLLGTTAFAGPGNRGIVFKLKTDGTGFDVLHAFTDGTDDGSEPLSSLTVDGAGNIYGTTSLGGSSNAGTLFKMKTDGTSFQLLHSFAYTSDGSIPSVPVILDGRGNLYGTAWTGGPSGLGTVFTVRADGTGFQILHAFGGDESDGQNPVSLFLESGTLFGTTSGGGAGGLGTVFALGVGVHRGVVTPGPFVPVRKR